MALVVFASGCSCDDSSKSSGGGKCPAGTELCEDTCVDLEKSASNCGTCGNACASAMLCSGGGCTCPDGLADCDGDCVDLESNGQNCGTCGNDCSLSGQFCSMSACSAACAEGRTPCGASCVDLDTSQDNCGQCARVCPPGQVCSTGQCGCNEGLSACGDACVDLTRDPLNCGDCGQQCGANASCVSGACVGGTENTGGSTGAGGAPPTNNGGSDPSVDGGSATGGGSVASGGAVASGGIVASGGSVASGGGSASGGTATGGSVAAGGTGGSSLPTDLPTQVTISPPSGPFSGTLAVTFTPNQPGGEIRYTTDGTLPSSSSTLYDGTSVLLSQSTQLRVALFIDGNPVASGSGFYVSNSLDLTVELPIVVLDDFGAGEPDREYVDAALLVYDSPGASLVDPPTLVTRAGIHLRGNSSAMFPKPPYRVELRDDVGRDLDQPLLGMPAESDWVLRNPYADKALIRDAFFYSLSRDMGMPSPRFALCELYRNVDETPVDPDDYLGVYLMVETIKNQRDRLDLQQLKDDDITLPDITGGYIFKFDWMAAEEPLVECTAAEHCWQDLEVVDPDPLQPEQEAWLAEYLTGFTNALFGDSFGDASAGYAPYIDVGSFVDQVIINELGREMDAYVRSQYFYKDRDGKLYAGPIWDRDLTFDTGGFFENREIEGFMYQSQFGITWEGEGGAGGAGGDGTGGASSSGVSGAAGASATGGRGGWGVPGWGVPGTQVAMTRQGGNDWFPRLMEDPAFQAQLAARWQSLRTGLLSDAELDARIADLAAPLATAAARNFAKWDILTTEMVVAFYTPTEDSWEGQVAHMQQWMHERIAWLDTQWQ